MFANRTLPHAHTHTHTPSSITGFEKTAYATYALNVTGLEGHMRRVEHTFGGVRLCLRTVRSPPPPPRRITGSEKTAYAAYALDARGKRIERFNNHAWELLWT